MVTIDVRSRFSYKRLEIVLAPASSLSIAEIRLMKCMLAHPYLFSDQSVLAHFTRPGRDLNQRIVWEARNDRRWWNIPPASLQEALAYSFSVMARQPSPAHLFVGDELTSRFHTMLARINLDWWPAGQGLFASGSLTRNGMSPFTWVYDCGTLSEQSIIDRSIDHLENKLNDVGYNRIDLLVLSHFDNDHLSGIVRLLTKFPVDRLLLPYMPRWHRLLIAVGSGLSYGDAEFEFFLDPVAYLTRTFVGRIGEIVIVGPTEPGEEPEPPEASPSDPDAPSSEPGSLNVDYGEPLPDAQGDLVAANGSTRVRYLRAAGRLTLPGLWEFVPYNDGHLAPRIGPHQIALIGRLHSILMNRSMLRKRALKRLKLVYESIFLTSKHRNQISLFLYCGPTGPNSYLLKIEGIQSFPIQPAMISQMHTGDAYLTDGKRFDAFEAFFKPSGRIARSAFLQVMHHGAEGNWHNGIAAKLKPRWSIFSSNPEQNNKHPDAIVLRDFWPYQPIQVDKVKGFHVLGIVFQP